jgi:predicted Zn-dependent protease
VAVLVAVGCAGRAIRPIGAGGEAFAPEREERQLWQAAEREEATLRERVRVHGDARLGAYLDRVAARLVRDEVRAAGGPPLRVVVLEDPTLNAFAMPGGAIYVHTGLLAGLEDESQVAAVLARQVVHVTDRHAFRRVRRGGDGALPGATALAGIGIASATRPTPASSASRESAVIGAAASAILGSGLRVAALASVTGYGRELELEADVEAMDRLVQAGWDPRSLARTFERLRREAGERDAMEVFLHGTADWLEERAARALHLVATRHPASLPSPPVTGGEFDALLRSAVRDNAALDVRAGRFAVAARQIARVLAAAPDDPPALLHDGELHRLRGQRAASAAEAAEHVRLARERYERVIALDPALVDALRQLGLLYYATGDSARARQAFERYLMLRPSAPDAARISEYLADLGP